MSEADRPIRDFMNHWVHTIPLESSLPDARRVMQNERIRHLPVVDGTRLVGLLSERDLGRLEGFPMVDFNLVSVPDAMTSPPYAVPPDTPILEVLLTMWRERKGSAIVVEHGNVVGLFTTTDAIGALIAMLQPGATAAGAVPPG